MNGHGNIIFVVLMTLALVFTTANPAMAQRRGFGPDKGPAGKPLTVCCKICKGTKCRHLTMTAERCVRRGGRADNRRFCSPVKRCCRLHGKFSRLPARNCRAFGGHVVNQALCRMRTCRHMEIAGPAFYHNAKTIAASAQLTGCPRTMRVTLRLREDIEGFLDHDLNSYSTDIGPGNGRINIRYKCKRSLGSKIAVFAELIVVSKKLRSRKLIQSRRLTVRDCS